MSHLLHLTKVYATTVELTDEEYAEYLENRAAFLDPYWSDMDVVDTDVEHQEI